MRKKNPIISQKEAASIAGVSTEAIRKLQGTRSFFTDSKPAKVNTSHPDWQGYLREQMAKHKTPQKKLLIEDAFQWGNFKPESIQEEKTYADILTKKIEIMKSMESLIEKKIVIAAFGEIVKAIQSNLIDYEKRVAPLIAAKLGMPGTEKMIEKIMGAEKKKSMENVIDAAERAIDKL